MKLQKKHVRAVLLFMICMLMAFGSVQAQAKNMKSETKGTVKWGFKFGKTLTYYSYWGGVGMIPQNVKVTSWKDKKIASGRRRLSFKLNFIRKRKPTAKQLINAATYYTVYHPDIDDTSPNCYFTVVDYKTGISLEDSANPYGVKVTYGKWRKSKGTTYKIKGYGLTMTNVSVKVKIDYPASYKGICIGIGGVNRLSSTNNDNMYWKGIFPFWMTDSYRSASTKKVSHFRRWWKGKKK